MSKKRPNRVKKPAPAAKPRKPRQVPRHEQQLALIGDTLLDIEAALRILRAAPRRLEHIDVDSWARLYGLDGNPRSPIKIGPLFDPEHARTADLRRPLILVTFRTGDDEETCLIADGSHRLHRGYTEGRDSLPAWILTAAETDAITITRPTSTPAPTLVDLVPYDLRTLRHLHPPGRCEERSDGWIADDGAGLRADATDAADQPKLTGKTDA